MVVQKALKQRLILQFDTRMMCLYFVIIEHAADVCYGVGCTAGRIVLFK